MPNTIDARFGPRLRENLPDVLNLLVADNGSEIRSKFLKDPTRSPYFTYHGRLVGTPFERMRRGLLRLSVDIHAKASPPLCLLYESKIKEGLRQIDLLWATLYGDDIRHEELSENIYGAPSILALQTTLGKLERQLNESDRRQDYPALQPLLEGSRITAVDPRSIIDQLDIPEAQSFAHESVVAHKDGVAWVAQGLAKYDVPDWSYEVDTTGERTGLMASTHLRKILIPGQEQWQKRPRRETSIRAVIEHELTHARRSANGSQKCTPLGLGLRGSFQMEEAAATWVEHSIIGADDLPGYLYMLGIGAALGRFDGQKRVFHEVFELVYEAVLLESRRAEPDESAEERHFVAQNRAYTVTFRVFRGTTGCTPGACSYKDTIYRNGAARLWPIIVRDEWVRDTLFAGEFDPTMIPHVKPLIELGFLPERSA